MEENIKVQDFIDGTVALDLIKGVKMEVYNTGSRGQYLVALYDRSDCRGPIQGSWQLSETDAMRKIRDIYKKYGKENVYGKVSNVAL